MSTRLFPVNVPTFVYDDFLDRLASFGFVVVSMWRVDFFASQEQTSERILRVRMSTILQLEILQSPLDLVFFSPSLFIYDIVSQAYFALHKTLHQVQNF